MTVLTPKFGIWKWPKFDKRLSNICLNQIGDQLFNLHQSSTLIETSQLIWKSTDWLLYGWNVGWIWVSVSTRVVISFYQHCIKRKNNLKTIQATGFSNKNERNVQAQCSCKICDLRKHNGQLYCVKIVRIRSYSGSHFPAFGLNT